MHEQLSILTSLAIKTGDLLMSYYKDSKYITDRKADNSVVTEADIHADRFIHQELMDAFPDCDILSEELEPQISAKLNDKIFIVDPLDGTTNFTLGIHHWGVLITQLNQGIPVACVQHFPLLGETYTSAVGEGAYQNGYAISVEPPDDQRKISCFSCCSRAIKHYHIKIPYKIRIFGSAAYSFCSLARGVSCISFEAKAKIWDIAGAWLLVQEAGGVIGVLSGEQPFPLQKEVDYSRVNFSFLAAANQKLLDMAHRLIVPNHQNQ